MSHEDQAAAASYLDKLHQELEQLRAATRLAHEAIADMKAERAATKLTMNNIIELRRQLHEESEKDVQATIKEEVQKGLVGFNKALGKAIDNSTEAVYRRFDTISAILLGEERDDDRPSIVELTHRVRAAMEEKGIAKVPPALRRQR